MNRRLAALLALAAGLFIAAAGRGHAAEVSASEPAVVLPPFLVEVAKPNGPPWRYTQSPEFEILSRVPDSTTQELAQSYHRLHRLLSVVLPDRFQVQFDVPRTLILYDQDLLPTAAQAMFADAAPSNPAFAATPRPDRRYGVLRNPRLSDIDAMTVFASLPPSAFAPDAASPIGLGSERTTQPGFRPGWTSFTPGYVEDLIAKRTPPLPTWFVSGFSALYRKMHFSEGKIELGAVFWLSERDTRGLRTNPKELPSLLSIPELLDGPAGNSAKIDLWFAQTELFVRWALEDQKGFWREGFWKFIDRSCTEPASETLFKECFGIDYGRGATLLRLYLVSAVLNPAVWRAEGPAELPPLLFRDATGSDLSRIKGDWERLAANYVRTNLPALETPYVEQARRTLRRSYDKGDRDPRLLAALGLAECDAGHASGARDFLEAAMRGGVVRPRAYLELARLRFAEQRAHLEAPGEKLSVAPTTEVLAPLLIARRQAPPLQPVYELIAEAWMSSAVAPQRTDLAVLDEGVSFFPKSAELIHRTATLYFAQGFSTEAANLVETGLRVAPNEATRARFNALRAAIASGK